MEIIEVAAGLVFRAGRLLITQRHPGAHLGGLWEFPGGKREADESFEACLGRELHEELGIDVQVGPLIGEVTHHYPDKSVRLKFFSCRLLREEPRAIDCHDIAWVRPDQLDAYSFPAADERLLQKLRSAPELWR